MKNVFLITFLFAFLLLTQPTYVLANGYGAGYGQSVPAQKVPSILVDKLVAYPRTLANEKVEYVYVDNLGSSDYKFKPNQYVYLKIKVKNTSSNQLTNLIGYDYVPSYLNPYLQEENKKKPSPEPKYDEKTRLLTFTVGTLAAGEEKIYDLIFRIAPQNELPQDKGIFCIVNKTEVKNNEVGDDDSSQFCIEKDLVSQQVIQPEPPKKIPDAGPEHGLLIVSFSSLMGFAGLKLRRYNS